MDSQKVRNDDRILEKTIRTEILVKKSVYYIISAIIFFLSILNFFELEKKQQSTATEISKLANSDHYEVTPVGKFC